MHNEREETHDTLMCYMFLPLFFLRRPTVVTLGLNSCSLTTWTSVSGSVRSLKLLESCSSPTLRRKPCWPGWSDPHGQHWLRTYWLTYHCSSLSLLISHIKATHPTNKTLVCTYLVNLKRCRMQVISPGCFPALQGRNVKWMDGWIDGWNDKIPIFQLSSLQLC